MTTEAALLNIAENLPDDLKIELLHYAEYLMNKSLNTPKKPLAGSMKGTFILPLSEDFDAPLEDLRSICNEFCFDRHPRFYLVSRR
ncbi:type II toxin-antitoxin system VapB family antitoxin [Synechocystis salina]|uniref:type II toxin-antitoxin system VapB family antitoxin n=1 Tax=Synechocystis salina TaxID=945780 RepID=UPI001D13B94C|nr:DUF2281 domain-containing protein [Synechocystis salina]